MKIYFDGGCNPNPGKMEVCIVVEKDGTKKPFSSNKMGNGTNNIAEWMAMLWAANYALENGETSVELIGDSKLVINQASGVWRVKDNKFDQFKQEIDIIRKKIKIKFTHVRRDYNPAGTWLEFRRV